MTETQVGPRPCTPEWCESGGEPHDDVCDNAPMGPMTKHEWVEHSMAGAEHAIASYRFFLDEGFNDAEAKEQAVEELEEAAVCFAGIGSCGRGWCDHS